MRRDALPSPFRVEVIRFTLHQHSSQNCPKSEVRRDQLMSIRVVCSWSFVPCCFCKIDLTSNLSRLKDKASKRVQAFMSASFMREAPTASSYFSHTITSQPDESRHSGGLVCGITLWQHKGLDDMKVERMCQHHPGITPQKIYGCWSILSWVLNITKIWFYLTLITDAPDAPDSSYYCEF